MKNFQELIENNFFVDSTPKLLIPLGCLFVFAILLVFGRRFDSALKLERLGIPISLFFGAFALLIGPHGPHPILPESITDVWVKLPTPLLTLVFATLMLGRPLPQANSLWKPVTSQAIMGFLLGFGQYLIGGIAVLLVLIPYLNVDPLMGCLIEIGFEGGHGAAAVMGKSLANLGFPEGLDLGLAMATVGLLASTLLGSGLVVIGRLFGWISFNENQVENRKVEGNQESNLEQIKLLALNLGFIGLAVLFGVATLSFIRLVSSSIGGIYYEVISVFPVFPLALIGSLLIRYLLEKFDLAKYVSEILQREIGIISTDLLITTAMAALDLPLLIKDWIPLTILALSGIIWNLLGMFLFAKVLFKINWFERSIIEFGNANGVAASGILLLRLADPIDKSNTLPIFSIKQLFLQPLLSGGFITVIAPVFIVKFGLIGWTEICGAMTILFIFIALFTQPILAKDSG